MTPASRRNDVRRWTEAGAISERLLNLIAGGGLLTLAVYGFIAWKTSGDAFPADMRRSTLEIRERGFLLSGTLSPTSGENLAGVGPWMRPRGGGGRALVKEEVTEGSSPTSAGPESSCSS